MSVDFIPGTLVRVWSGELVVVTYDKFYSRDNESFPGVQIWPQDEIPLTYAERLWFKEDASPVDRQFAFWR